MPVLESVATITASAATSAIGEKVVGSILDDVQETVERIASNTSIVIKNVVEDLLAQLSTSIEEISRQVARDLNRLVREVSEEVRVQLYSLSLAAEKLVFLAAEEFDNVTEEAIREVRQTLSRTVIYTEDFALDEIEGTLVQSNVHRDPVITVTGLNVGYDSEDIQSSITLILTPPNSPDVRIPAMELSASKIEFVIPIELVEQLRTEFTSTILSGYLDIFIKKDRLLIFDKKFRKKQPVKIVIAPRISGEIQARAKVENLDWVKRAELDQDISIQVPSGHATSSSDVVMHTTNRTMSVPRASAPPLVDDRRFYSAGYTGCAGGGCTHIHEKSTRIANNGAQVHITIRNNSHASTVSFRGNVERFEVVSEQETDEQLVSIRHGQVLVCVFDATATQFRFEGMDADFGPIDLVAERKTVEDSYPMPTGQFGGLNFLGTNTDENHVHYRFMRKEPR